jgi:hypothetical protein
MKDTTFVSLDNALASVAHDIDTPKGSPDYLRAHPGHGLSVLEFGMQRLLGHPIVAAHTDQHAAVIEAVRGLYRRAEMLCESPIERNLLAALITGCWAFSRSALPIVHDVRNPDEGMPNGDVVIIPQLNIGRYRLDIAVVIERAGYRRIVGLECDGAEFHKDRERDFNRDEWLRGLGVTTIHFTGSELFKAPIATADEIIRRITDWRDA